MKLKFFTQSLDTFGVSSVNYSEYEANPKERSVLHEQLYQH